MARKSTIPNPDALLPEATDLMEGAVQRNRERTGRKPPEDDKTTQPRTHATTQPTEVDTTVESVPPTNRESEVERTVASMRATTGATLNTRIPSAFKEWLDTRAFKGRHDGVTIQSQTEEAIAEYIAKRLAEEQ